MRFNIFCGLLGHKWRYKDYTNAFRENGVPYPYTDTRKCVRCEKKQYKFASWVDEKLAPNDRPEYS